MNEKTEIKMTEIIIATANFTAAVNPELWKSALRLLYLLSFVNRVKPCIEVSTNQPYLSTPAYLEDGFIMMFPYKVYKSMATSKDWLLTLDE